MGGIELADEEGEKAAELVGCSSRCHARGELLARGVPVDTVHRRIRKVVAQPGPGLLKRLSLLAGEVDVHLGSDGDRAALRRLDGRGGDPAAIKVVNLLTIGRELQ